jgi:hypothetical protein
LVKTENAWADILFAGLLGCVNGWFYAPLISPKPKPVTLDKIDSLNVIAMPFLTFLLSLLGCGQFDRQSD